MISQLEVAKKREPEKRVNGIFWIILLNIGIFVADHFFQVDFDFCLYLEPEWVLRVII
jgi:hypothetical protein